MFARALLSIFSPLASRVVVTTILTPAAKSNITGRLMYKQPGNDSVCAIHPLAGGWRRQFGYGVHDEGHLHRVKREVPPAVEFFRVAEICLRAIADEVIGDLAQNLGAFPGKWNPLGFVVWHLGLDARGNSLRLHAWPSLPRKIATFRPGVHCHAWYLSSYMLAGGYRDRHYNIIEQGYYPEDERIARGYLRRFSLEYLACGASTLINRGECVSLQLRQEDHIEPGSVHHIKDGILHATSIPEHLDTLTLVLDSPSLGYNTTTVLDCGPAFPTLKRVPVTPQEVAHVQSLLQRLTG